MQARDTPGQPDTSDGPEIATAVTVVAAATATLRLLLFMSLVLPSTS